MLELHGEYGQKVGNEQPKLTEIFDGFSRSVIAVMAARDPATAIHSQRVSTYTLALAHAVHESQLPPFAHVQFTSQQFEELRFASLLHDIGKVVLRREILLKSAKLTDPDLAHLLERIDLFAAWFGTQTPEKLGDAYRSPRDFDAYRETVQRVVQADVQPDAADEQRLAEMARTFITPCPDLPLLSPAEFECLHIAHGTLSESERDEIRQHAIVSWQYLTQIPWPKQWEKVPVFVLQHHEKLDGSGYPYGLAGDQILIQSRMITVCDIFDALTGGDRSYKTRHDFAAAARFLDEDVREGRLDSDIVALFKSEIIPKIRDLAEPV